PKNGPCRSTTGARRSTASSLSSAIGCRRWKPNDQNDPRPFDRRGRELGARSPPPARFISRPTPRMSYKQKTKTKTTYTDFFTKPLSETCAPPVAAEIRGGFRPKICRVFRLLTSAATILRHALKPAARSLLLQVAGSAQNN